MTVRGGGEAVRVVGTMVGHRNRPHLLEAWGQRFNLQLEDHIALFRNSDVPGMIGRVGTCSGSTGSTSPRGGRPPAARATASDPTSR